LAVQPSHYLTVHEHLMGALEEVLGDELTPDIHSAWTEALLVLSKILIDREDELCTEARRRNGGWRGFQEFRVIRRESETATVTSFVFKPVGSTGVYFDFSPGQYLTLRVEPDSTGKPAFRHYTVTSLPGLPYLQISVKRLPGGKVSNFLHDHLLEGRKLHLSPPFGNFTASLLGGPAPPGGGSVVLLSAGIGITPMFALLQALGPKRVVVAAHVDKREETHAFRHKFLETGVAVQVHYTSEQGRPTPDIAARLAKTVGTEHDWYLCGPGGFMCDAMRALSGAGVDPDRIHHESFGPRLCPMNG
jgi:nitric oxide dioxygenase